MKLDLFEIKKEVNLEPIIRSEGSMVIPSYLVWCIISFSAGSGKVL